MIELRKAADRGDAQHGWLDSRHTFSFADYLDRQQMGWGTLRVINDDTVQPGQGFGAHSHRDNGDHLVCPRRRTGTQRLHGLGISYSPRRRSSHERGDGRPA